jgi:hypothetical protein
VEKRDFEFLKKVTSSFFKNRIASRIQSFRDSDITDFEKWLQVELVLFMFKMTKRPEVKREHPVSFHRGKAKGVAQKGMRIDFCIRPHGCSTDWFILLEVKQKWSVQECITHMVKDLNKIYMGRDSEKSARSFWSLGVHQYEDRRAVEQKVLDTGGGWANEKFIHTRKIPGTDFGYTIF